MTSISPVVRAFSLGICVALWHCITTADPVVTINGRVDVFVGRTVQCVRALTDFTAMKSGCLRAISDREASS